MLLRPAVGSVDDGSVPRADVTISQEAIQKAIQHRIQLFRIIAILSLHNRCQTISYGFAGDRLALRDPGLGLTANKK